VTKLSANNYQPETSQIRLFHRDAAGLAAALDGALGNIGVKALGSDLLVFRTSGPSDETKVRELKRLITVLDSPRPEITLNAWSVQASSPKPEAVDSAANAVHAIVYRYNDELQAALQRGWGNLEPIREDTKNWAKPFSY
jgi:hypothetical protein